MRYIKDSPIYMHEISFHSWVFYVKC